MDAIFDNLKARFMALCEKNHLLKTTVVVRARGLTAEEAIGHPDDDDFPLQKGKECLMHAELCGGAGQAFTDRYGDFSGTLETVMQMPLKNNYRRAVFVSTLNAALRQMRLIQGTIHCRDGEPGQCGAELADHIKSRFGSVKITQVGFQPRMVQQLAGAFPLRLLDLDPDNIGTRKFGVQVEGPEMTEAALRWADLLIVTGTTLVNNTIGPFLSGPPVLFYGTTIAGAAYLMEWDRFCARST